MVEICCMSAVFGFTLGLFLGPAIEWLSNRYNKKVEEE